MAPDLWAISFKNFRPRSRRSSLQLRALGVSCHARACCRVRVKCRVRVCCHARVRCRVHVCCHVPVHCMAYPTRGIISSNSNCPFFVDTGAAGRQGGGGERQAEGATGAHQRGSDELHAAVEARSAEAEQEVRGEEEDAGETQWDGWDEWEVSQGAHLLFPALPLITALLIKAPSSQLLLRPPPRPIRSA